MADALTQENRTSIQYVIDLLRGLLDASPAQPPAPQPRKPIVWGAKVSQTFRDRVWWIADTLGFDPDWIMSCIAWETGRTFSASVTNQAGSGATGLIQFMPDTMFLLKHGLEEYKRTPRAERIRIGKGYCAELAKMTAEDQLNYVYKYFLPWAGKVHSLSDLYMCILWPPAVGKPDDYIVFDGRSGGIAYRQNAGFDTNHDKVVTKAECSAKLYAIKSEGERFAA